MVRITGYSLRENKEGKSFIVLELQSELVLVQSAETGRFYATAKKCTMTSTFDEDTAKLLVGKELPGRIEKIACEDYDFTVEETGEVITLSHRWEYLPEGAPTPLRVVSSNMAA